MVGALAVFSGLGATSGGSGSLGGFGGASGPIHIVNSPECCQLTWSPFVFSVVQ
tara:strand:+ start:354 stop:515 length:162 start_codon:yes stop_codon:yes gene_type:complete